MDFSEIKNIIEQEGGKVIIVENNKPVVIALSYEEYKKRGNFHNPGNPSAAGQIDSKEMQAQRYPSKEIQPTVITTPPKTSLQEQRREELEELTIDDLPL